MPDSKFVFTVSGVTLSEAQRHKVSAAIGAAVAHALGEGSTHPVRSDFLNIGRIHGGLWIDVAELEKVGIKNVLNSSAVVGGARAE
ncbi:MAG: hypothetical protein BGP12_03580 [Rhodospirillales bacterium 70-18]|mgnify:CR=1 FL=1|nr:hypothetical protein [Rhodospirillales bacterium]OJY64830.1 MAG: hypothetical protein BGP12_03580 [Rhodospirillales bacterium 70-18]